MSRNNYISSSIIGNFYQQPNISKSPVKGLSYPLASSNPNSKYSGSMGNTSNTPKGLQNLTNTCYISAVLQILFQIINEKDFPIMNKYKQEVTYHYFILKDSKSKRDYENFKEVVEKRIEIVQGWQQQDAHQFLIHLLEQFRKQNSLPLKVGKTVNLNYNPSQNYQNNWQRFTNEMMKLQNSKIINMVSGDILKRFTCQRKHVKHNFERFNNISLHFPSSSYSYQQDPIPIQTMIQKYFGPEEIDDLFCEQCKYKTQFQKQASIFSAPKYLILHISRFSKGYFQSEKNKSEVKFNSSLFFNSFREKQAKYRLIGIVNHTGSLNRGHFYANVLISNEWYQMNDQSVYRETIKPKDNISSTVYMLVYQKQGK